MTLDIAEVEVALYKMIRDTGVVPERRISVPNLRAEDQSHPRIEIERPFIHHSHMDAKGAIQREVGTLAVIFVMEKDSGYNAATKLAQRLREMLPIPHVVQLPTQGYIEIVDPITLDSGYADYGSFRLPAHINYDAKS